MDNYSGDTLRSQQLLAEQLTNEGVMAARQAHPLAQPKGSRKRRKRFVLFWLLMMGSDRPLLAL